VDGHQATTLSPEAQAHWEEISGQIEEIWSEVINVANNVLKVHAKFGFEQFADNISPSLEDILFSLQVVESVLDTVATANLEYSETRKIGNAKQQILWIHTIGNALKYGNEEDYLASIKMLSSQGTA